MDLTSDVMITDQNLSLKVLDLPGVISRPRDSGSQQCPCESRVSTTLLEQRGKLVDIVT